MVVQIELLVPIGGLILFDFYVEIMNVMVGNGPIMLLETPFRPCPII